MQLCSSLHAFGGVRKHSEKFFCPLTGFWGRQGGEAQGRALLLYFAQESRLSVPWLSSAEMRHLRLCPHLIAVGGKTGYF